MCYCVYPVTTSEPDRAGIYHAGLAGAARREFLGEFHREEPMKRRRGGGEQAPMSRERAVTRYQGDVRVNRPRPQALHVLLIGARSQAYLRRYWFRWTEWRLSSKNHHSLSTPAKKMTRASIGISEDPLFTQASDLNFNVPGLNKTHLTN